MEGVSHGLVSSYQSVPEGEEGYCRGGSRIDGDLR